jgi:hypothetical protein
MNPVNPQLDPALIQKIGVVHAVTEKVQEYLRAVPQISTVVKLIFDEDSLTIVQQLQEALKGTAKLSIMVGTGDATDDAEGVNDLIVFRDLKIQVLCIEQPNLNRGTGGTNVTVNRLSEMVACTLKGKQIGNFFVTKVDFQIPKQLGGTVAARLVVLTCGCAFELNNNTLIG